MAKSLFSGDSTNFSDVSTFVNQFIPAESSLVDQPKTEFIPVGSYVLSACLSGSLFGGIATGHCTMISGDPKTGKTYIILDVIRYAQQAGYYTIVFDSEHAHTRERYLAQGIDPDRCRIIVPETINEITVTMTQLTQSLQDTQLKLAQENKKLPKDQQKTLPKIAVFIDSVSALSSEKQIQDAIAGDMKSDMGTVAKELKVMYNILIPRFGKLGIPLVCTAHTYEKQEGYQMVKTISGGQGSMYMPSVVVNLRKKFDKDESKQKQGIIVTANIMESRFSRHRPVEFYISFTKGINRYLGLQDYLGWDVCGIAPGKMVDFVDLLEELFNKKQITEETLLSKTFKTKDVLDLLAQSKRAAFGVSLQEDIDEGYIELVGNTQQQTLPCLVDFIEQHSLQDGFDTVTIAEKAKLANIYDEHSFQSWLQSAIDADWIYVLGSAKLNTVKNQKFKVKRTAFDAQRTPFVYTTTGTQTKYNDKQNQEFRFTERARTLFDGGKPVTRDHKVCFPQETAQTWCVKHLNRAVDFTQLFNKTVMTPEVLKAIDEKLIRPAFEYRQTFVDEDDLIMCDDNMDDSSAVVSDFEQQLRAVGL